jgi:phospholipase C
VPHVIIVIQENQTFDSYFGRWCTAAPGSNPTCTSGAPCCEGAPDKEPAGASPVTLDDEAHAAYDPNHQQPCELAEIHGGAMDRFCTNTDPAAPATCADARNFAIAPDSVIKPYHDLAANGALADRYFQSIAGQSSANDMYFAVAKEVFIDNAYKPDAPGKQCNFSPVKTYTGETTIADLLKTAGKKVTWYSEGWDAMVAAGTNCPTPPKECAFGLPTYPCVFDPSDVPFLYYDQIAKDPAFMADYTRLATDLAANQLPEVSFVKAIGYHTEHPGAGTTISDGVKFVTDLVKTVGASCYADNTLILVTWDEGGGFFDHVTPPATSTVDNQPYGTRVPLIAVGRHAKKGTISHTTLEHSSIVKFLEYNFLEGKTGQLGARDAVVNNIGSLIDAAAYGEAIPD